MASGLDLSALGAYTEEHGPSLVNKAVAQSRTLKYVSIQQGVKSAMIVDTVSSTIAVQAAASGWNSSGTTAIAKVTLTATPYMIQNDLSMIAAEAKNLQYYTAAGSTGAYSSTQLAVKLSEELAEQVKLWNENKFWDATGGIQYFMKTYSGSSAYNITANTYSAITSTNAVTLVDLMKANVPAPIRGSNNKLLFMGEDAFDNFVVNLKNSNYYHIDPTQELDYEFKYLGITCVGVAGLNNTNKMILTAKENIWAITDNLSESDKIDVFWDRGQNMVKQAAYWKFGSQIYFPDFCVMKH